jgi:hypothetical protein
MSTKANVKYATLSHVESSVFNDSIDAILKDHIWRQHYLAYFAGFVTLAALLLVLFSKKRPLPKDKGNSN